MGCEPAVRLVEYPLEDDGGTVLRVEVSEDVATVLRTNRRPRRARSFTDLGDVCDELQTAGTARRITARRQLDDDAGVGNPWEGPRLRFAHLLGEGMIWTGDPNRGGECQFCGGARLPESTYCLGCDRTSAELRIPSPSERPRRRPYVRGRLAGGLGRAGRVPIACSVV